MEVVARVSKIWRKRMILLTAFALGAAGWFFYDGFVGYPKQIVRAKEFQQFEREGRVPDWPAHAASKGWRTDNPGPPKTAKDLATQKQCGLLGVVLALGLAGYWLWSEGRSMRLEGELITAPTGTQVRLEEIKAVDRKKWDTKGIALAIYERDGERRKLIIDDYKYEGAVKILEEVERRLGMPDQAA
jgi:hypothetical protein